MQTSFVTGCTRQFTYKHTIWILKSRLYKEGMYVKQHIMLVGAYAPVEQLNYARTKNNTVNTLYSGWSVPGIEMTSALELYVCRLGFQKCCSYYFPITIVIILSNT